jgi:hypothetical protein
MLECWSAHFCGIFCFGVLEISSGKLVTEEGVLLHDVVM